MLEIQTEELLVFEDLVADPIPFNVGIKETESGIDIALILTPAQFEKIQKFQQAGVYNEELLDKYNIRSIGIKVLQEDENG